MIYGLAKPVSFIFVPNLSPTCMAPIFKTPVCKMVFGALTVPESNDYGTSWKAGMIISEDASQALFKIIAQQLEDARSRDPKFPKSNEKLKMPWQPSMDKDADGNKTPKEGEFLWIFNRKTTRTVRGETVKVPKPKLWDANGSLITDLDEVPRGSEGVIHFEVRCYTMSGGGVSFYLHGFQISKLGDSGTPDLTPIEGGEFVVNEGGTPLDMNAVLSE